MGNVFKMLENRILLPSVSTLLSPIVEDHTGEMDGKSVETQVSLQGRTVDQGSKLRLTGRQCDQKLSTGDEIFRTSRQLATRVLSNN